MTIAQGSEISYWLWSVPYLGVCGTSFDNGVTQKLVPPHLCYLSHQRAREYLVHIRFLVIHGCSPVMLSEKSTLVVLQNIKTLQSSPWLNINNASNKIWIWKPLVYSWESTQNHFCRKSIKDLWIKYGNCNRYEDNLEIITSNLQAFQLIFTFAYFKSQKSPIESVWLKWKWSHLQGCSNLY